MEPDSAVRMMWKYLESMYECRSFLKNEFGLEVLQNLDDLELINDETLEEYYKNIAKAYMDTYSLDGPFGRIANLGYLCVPNIDLICQHITSTNPLLQKRALKVIARDKVVIDLINLCLDAEEDLTDPKMKEKVIDRVFFALDYLKYIPLEKEIKLDTKGLNREYRKEASKGDEGKYAEIGKSVSDGLIKLGRSYQDANVVHSKQ